MRPLALVLALLAGCAFADTILKNNGTTVGPVTSLDCALDGGINCSRATGSSTGKLTCVTAAPGVSGCVSSGAQAFGGAKSFNNGVTVHGAVLLDGGVYINGPVLLDGGVQVNGSLFVDAGIIARSGVNALTYVSRNGTFTGATGSDGGTPTLTMVGRDTAAMATTGIQFLDGVNIPHTAPLPAYSPGGPGTGAFRKVVSGKRFSGPGQVSRLSGTVNRVGTGDGGLAVDGGASQVFYIEVYNQTAGVMLCASALKACNLSAGGMFGNPCGPGADAGGFFVQYDDLVLAIHDEDCLDAPSINFNVEYLGPQ